jgi:hypothetical protein
MQRNEFDSMSAAFPPPAKKISAVLHSIVETRSLIIGFPVSLVGADYRQRLL